jgi:hypothetical protein
VVAVAVVALFGIGGASGAERRAAAQLAAFTTPGYYFWTVPAGVTKVTFDVYGAGGGNVVNGRVLEAVGGPGGETKARIGVTAGESFEITVGGRGGDAQGNAGGGYGSPDGGPGGPGDYVLGVFGGGGGGGESNVALGASGVPCLPNPPSAACNLYERIVVAGGGGGGGASLGNSGEGGAGGGLVGQDGQPDRAYQGGRQNRGGLAADPNCVQIAPEGCYGDFAYGGNGGLTGGGGGGGGWFGGGGGGTPQPGAVLTHGGGGGSGYYSSLVQSGSFPAGTKPGNGKVVISG